MNLTYLKYLLFFIFLLSIIKNSHAQQKKFIIKGAIVDSSTKEVLPWTNISINNENIGSTNSDGHFTISINENKLSKQQTVKITIKRVGYKPKTISINLNDSISVIPFVALDKTIEQQKEVVVVGYGSTSKEYITGAVGVVNNNLLGAEPLSADQLLQNKVAGVQVSGSNGSPGSAVAITIRGITSLNNNGNGNAPLIVIDGVPIYGIDQVNNTVTAAAPQTTFGGGALSSNAYAPTNSFEQNPLATLNPDDIASIEVLKDAYATAIYGSRGAAGVILITTKRGSVQKATLNVEVSTSIQTPLGLPRGLMNGDQYATFYNTFYDSLKARGFNGLPSGTFPKGVNTNWLQNVIRPGVGVDASISVSGGSDRLRYFISGSYNKTQSYIINNYLQRASARINLDGKITSRLNVGVSIQVSYLNNNALNAGQIYYNAIIKAPNLPIYDTTGKYLWGYGKNPIGINTSSNPVGTANSGRNYLNDFRTTGNIYAEYTVLPWLKIRSEFGADLLTTLAYSRLIDVPSYSPGGIGVQSDNIGLRYVINNAITIDKKWHKHQIAAVIGQSFEKSNQTFSSYTGVGFLNDFIYSIQSANITSLTSSITNRWALLSYFARVNYVFLQKYIAGVTYRIDGSSLFSANNRFVGFPSFSLGWIPSKEIFWNNISPWFNSLKIRASLGIAGTDGGIGYYGQQGQYASTSSNDSYGNTQVITAVQPNNPNIRWERSTTIDGGFDAGFLNDKITFTFDGYQKVTNGAILNSPLPGFLGFSSVLQNVATISNVGFEFLIQTKNIQNRYFSWTSSLNFSTNTNKIISLSPTYSNYVANFANGQGLSNATQYWVAGQSATAFNLFNWGGVNKLTGNPIWIGSDGKRYNIPLDVVFSNSAQLLNAQRQYFGDALPKVFGGFENSFNYKGFQCTIFFSFSIGNKLFNGTKASLYSYTNSNANNLSTDLLNYWTKPGQTTNIPALLNASNITASNGSFTSSIIDYTVSQYISRFLEDASFLRLKNVTIAYNLPTHLLKILQLTRISCKVFAEMSNIFTITPYTGVDPEVSANGSNALVAGYDGISLPNPRTVRVGIKLGI